jgi:hypothetical protein
VRSVLLSLTLLLCAFAGAEDEPPTFTYDPEAPQRATGYKPPMTQEQMKLQQEFDSRANKEHWSFTDDASLIGKHPLTGYTPMKEIPEDMKLPPLLGDPKLKPFNIKDFGIELSAILNQKSCGSCVIFAELLNLQDFFKLRRFEFPEPLSAQEWMNCGSDGQCSGNYGKQVAQGLFEIFEKSGGLLAWSDYTYTARTSSCQEKDGDRYGKDWVDGFKFIEPTPKEILAALHRGQPVSTAVNASGPWGGYTGGVFNACGSQTQNHYVTIRGVTCGKSVDADGNCVFDEDGNLPPGEGTYEIANSWSLDYGVDGEVEMKITDKSGRPCNGVGREALVFTGPDMKPPGPVTLTYQDKGVKLTITVQPGAKYSAEEALAVQSMAMKSVGVK